MGVLLIQMPGSELPPWRLAGVQLWAAELSAGTLGRLSDQECEAAILLAGEVGDAGGELLAELETRSGLDVIPLLLAADGAAVESGWVDRLAWDGFLDVRWEGPLVERWLAATIMRVRTGRGIVALQHQILQEVREDIVHLRELSIRDAVTGLSNARHFRAVAEGEHQRARRHRRPYGLVLLELEDLGEINRLHGHLVGTQALARVGLVLGTTARACDHAARTGGDGFALLLPETDRAGAARSAERISGMLRSCRLLERGERISLGTSAGIASFPEDGQSLNEVLRAAGRALGEARASRPGLPSKVVRSPLEEAWNEAVGAGRADDRAPGAEPGFDPTGLEGAQRLAEPCRDDQSLPRPGA